jgi:hypothetical protein
MSNSENTTAHEERAAEEEHKFRPQELWDTPTRKFLCYVMEGVGIMPPDGGIQIKLHYELPKGKIKSASFFLLRGVVT